MATRKPKAKQRGKQSKVKAAGKSTPKPARGAAAGAKSRVRPTAAKVSEAREDAMHLLEDELAEARAELQRIGSGENSVRRDLENRSSRDAAVEERLRAELDAVRLDLRTALADLEIARAGESRAVGRVVSLEADLDEAEAQAGRLRAEIARLRDETPTTPRPAAGEREPNR